MAKNTLCVIFSGILFLSSHAQIHVFDPMSPDIDFINPRAYSQEIGKKYNPESVYSHPDFGQLTFDAPFGKQVVEDISKRTYDSRYYVDLNDPTFFYIQKSSNAINLFQNGIWRAIDPTLHPVSSQVYQSGVQPCPTKLDVGNKRTAIQLGGTEFQFNHYSLKVVHQDNSMTVHQANWSQVAIGNEGAYITDIFPGIDFKIQFAQGSIESDFIIRENLHVKKLIFVDQLTIPAHLNGFIYTNETVQNGPVIFENIYTGEAEIKFDRARCHDASENKHSWINPYTLNGNNLEILCDSAQLNDPAKIYPITVDPLVTAVGPIASALNVHGSRLTPLSCANTLNVTFPGGTTPWDVSAFWNIYTDFCADDLLDYGFYIDCYRSEAEVWITSSCGGISPAGAPSTIWTCAGCNSYGTWNPTLPFASSGTQTLAQCYTPSCSNQNLSFTINSRRTYCTNFYGYDLCLYANSYCNSLRQWSITVQGRNAETLANTATGNGSATYAAPTCASGTTLLNPAAQYGVPGYTYSWSTGATSSTLTVPNGPTTYTCQVTDACGTVRTATFTITCPLAINLSSFEVANSGDDVAINWSTSFEKENDHFVILRAGNDLKFEEIGQVSSQGDSEHAQAYSFFDREPLEGINYYQLATVDINAQMKLSDIRSIEKKTSSKVIAISPNPSKGSFTLRFTVPESGDYVLSLLSVEGKMESMQVHSLEKGNHSVPFNKLALQKGTYIVRVQKGNFSLEEKLVVE
ncbi:T9SS type A sorting domain-containing protein [Fluviicola chungangensis]|uniref:T9SS type A sorting domain-containing protein n=1 Tax=Fluviicola chungangensis TaxID=2597671 RepID=A0A556N342_9FLAO|nr:T9SS type A sorting domain-containing protein [Fluviicola chungangensis]TSJ46495.1 T9SS type A sorting domain-containing protein [Fluviicola chungangensis]